MKGKRSNRIFGLMGVLGLLVAFATGCDRYARHRVLTFFFTGVPPLEEEMKPPAKKVEVARLKNTKKTPLPKGKLFLHAPYAAKKCPLCHQTSGVFGRFRTKGMPVSFRSGMGSPGMLRLPLKKLCTKCHAYKSVSRAIKDGIWLHAPVATGRCTICHDPHQSPNPSMLIKNREEICLNCHLEGSFMLSSAAHREPRQCLDCHNPHLGKDRFMLAKNYKEVKHPVGPLAESSSPQALSLTPEPKGPSPNGAKESW